MTVRSAPSPARNPGTAAAQSATAPAAQVAPNPPNSADTAAPIPLLLAEDDHAMRVALAYILSHAGFAVEQAENGMKALALAKTGRFRIMLLDVQMPDMDGVRAAALIHRDPTLCDVPLVMISNHALPDNVRACLQAGAVDFVVKQGLDPQVLIAKLRKHLAAPRKSRAPNVADPAGPPAPATRVPGSPQGAADGPPSLTLEAWKKQAAELGAGDRKATDAALKNHQAPVLLPALAQEAQALLDAGAEAQLQALRLLEQDVGFLARIFAAARRQPDQAQGPAADVAAAVTRLGSAGLRAVLQQGPQPEILTGPDASAILQRWWCHSLAVSAVAGELAATAGISPATARLAGLLHEVGRLLLLTGPLRSQALACYQQAGRMNFPTTLAEQALFGLHYKQIGHEYCASLGLPPLLSSACLWHDAEDAQLDNLAASEAALARALGAADQIAKAAGFPALLNDELLPLPRAMTVIATGLEPQINHALEETRKAALFRLGSVPPTAAGQTSLEGMIVGFFSTAAGSWNPYQRTLTAAGARVVATRDPRDLSSQFQSCDALVCDAMASPLGTLTPALQQLTRHPAVMSKPKLLLARCSDEPEMIVQRCGLTMNVYSSPIRGGNLVSIVGRLTAG